MAPHEVDMESIQEAVRMILVAIGEDVNREGLKETPARVARMYADVLNGQFLEVEPYLKTFTEKTRNMVIVKDVPIYSFCEHHLALFQGKLHVGYIPDGKVIGLSKLVRIARVFAKRVQIQERLTDQIADALQAALLPKGVMVYIEAEHTCMTIRGVRTPGATTVTSAIRGVFADPKTGARNEFMEAING